MPLEYFLTWGKRNIFYLQHAGKLCERTYSRIFEIIQEVFCEICGLSLTHNALKNLASPNQNLTITSGENYGQ